METNFDILLLMVYSNAAKRYYYILGSGIKMKSSSIARWLFVDLHFPAEGEVKSREACPECQNHITGCVKWRRFTQRKVNFACSNISHIIIKQLYVPN